MILRLINLYERDITPFLNLLSVMGGYHISNQECKVFARKGLTRWGGELEIAEFAPIIHVRIKSNASMPWERKTPKPSPPPSLPPKVRMPSFNYLEFHISQMKAAVASLRATPPQPPQTHVNSLTGGDCRLNHSASSP